MEYQVQVAAVPAAYAQAGAFDGGASLVWAPLLLITLFSAAALLALILRQPRAPGRARRAIPAAGRVGRRRVWRRASAEPAAPLKAAVSSPE